MSSYLTTAGAFLTFMLGVCLLGSWPSKPREQHPEIPEVAPRPRRHGRMRSISPRRIKRSHSRSHSSSPGRYKHHRSRLPKHVTYMTIFTLFALMLGRTWGATLASANNTEELPLVSSVTITSVLSATAEPFESHSTRTLDSTLATFGGSYTSDPGPGDSLIHTENRGTEPFYDFWPINLTVYSDFYDCDHNGLNPGIFIDIRYGEFLYSGPFGPFQAIQLSRPLIGDETLQILTFPSGTDAATGGDPCGQEMQEWTSWVNPNVSCQLNTVRLGGPDAQCAIFNGNNSQLTGGV